MSAVQPMRPAPPAAGGPIPLAARAARTDADVGYRRDYLVPAAMGRLLLQRVSVHIRYDCGAERLADYRQTYYELFRFDRGDTELVDVHDFDLMRDGWRQAVVLAQVARHRAPGRPMPRGVPTLTVRKQFQIAPGRTHGTAPVELRPGAWFGMLASGPDGPSRAVLRLARGDGTWALRRDLAACPRGYAVQGHAVFADAGGFRAFEQYRHQYARLAGTFADRGSYVPKRGP